MWDSNTSEEGVAPSGGAPVDEGRVAVGQHEVRCEGEAGQSRPERRCGPEGTGHDLAVTAEYLGAGDGAVLGPTDTGGGGLGHAPSLAALAAARASAASLVATWYAASSTDRNRSVKAAHASGSPAAATYSFWNPSSRP